MMSDLKYLSDEEGEDDAGSASGGFSTSKQALLANKPSGGSKQGNGTSAQHQTTAGQFTSRSTTKTSGQSQHDKHNGGGATPTQKHAISSSFKPGTNPYASLAVANNGTVQAKHLEPSLSAAPVKRKLLINKDSDDERSPEKTKHASPAKQASTTTPVADVSVTSAGSVPTTKHTATFKQTTLPLQPRRLVFGDSAQQDRPKHSGSFSPMSSSSEESKRRKRKERESRDKEADNGGDEDQDDGSEAEEAEEADEDEDEDGMEEEEEEEEDDEDVIELSDSEPTSLIARSRKKARTDGLVFDEDMKLQAAKQLSTLINGKRPAALPKHLVTVGDLLLHLHTRHVLLEKEAKRLDRIVKILMTDEARSLASTHTTDVAKFGALCRESIEFIHQNGIPTSIAMLFPD